MTPVGFSPPHGFDTVGLGQVMSHSFLFHMSLCTAGTQRLSSCQSVIALHDSLCVRADVQEEVTHGCQRSAR